MTTFPIVGAHFRAPAKAILQVLPAGAPLILRREPSNIYDTNAIQVIVPTSSIPEDQTDTLEVLASGYGFSARDILAEGEWHVGYIPAARAVIEAPQWDSADITSRNATLTFNAKGEPRAEWDEDLGEGEEDPEGDPLDKLLPP